MTVLATLLTLGLLVLVDLQLALGS